MLILLLFALIIAMENNQVYSKTRPISPHLTIYKPQITSVLSILHRITGVVFLLGLLVFCWFITLYSYGAIGSNYSAMLFACLQHNMLCQAPVLLWLYSLLYHLCNGLRYLFWGFKLGFDLRTVTISGTSAIIASLFLLFLFYFLTLAFP